MTSIDFGVVLPYLPLFLQAAVFTVVLTVISQAIGTAAGFLLALGRVSRWPWLQAAVWTYVWIFRGTPMLLHLFFVYYAAPLVGLTLEAFPAAIIAMSLSSAAYNCEILRAGIQAVHHGQIEAAQAIGLPYHKVIRRIVVPQALRIVIAPYMGNFISHTKGSSLASVITVQEITLTAQMLYSSTYRAFEFITVAGAMYLLLTSLLYLAQLGLERFLAFDKRGLSQRRRRELLLDA